MSEMYIPQFIQLGDIFVTIKDIIYADFSDRNSVMLVLGALDKEAYGRRFVANEEMQFSVASPEYHALRKWLTENSLPLVPFSDKILEMEREQKA